MLQTTVRRKVGGSEMKEVEVKILEIDRGMIERRLDSLGASKTFEGDVETVFFDFPGNPIANANNLLRLRKIGDKTELTFKKFIANESAKVRDEYEVLVSDFETMYFLLESLGLVAAQRMKKHRISYVLQSGVRVDLDRYMGEFSQIPDLMEVEAQDTATLHSHIKLLGFKPEEGKSWTTFDLVDHYSGKRVKP
jgi:predicted adenylyl cyclase CyaB